MCNWVKWMLSVHKSVLTDLCWWEIRPLFCGEIVSLLQTQGSWFIFYFFSNVYFFVAVQKHKFSGYLHSISKVLIVALLFCYLSFQELRSLMVMQSKFQPLLAGNHHLEAWTNLWLHPKLMYLHIAISSPLALLIWRMPPRTSVQKLCSEREVLGVFSKDGLTWTHLLQPNLEVELLLQSRSSSQKAVRVTRSGLYVYWTLL